MELSDLNWFDITIITIVFVSSLLAFFRGFIKALFSLITWLGSAAIAIYFAPFFEEYLKNFIANETVTKVASILIIFLVVFTILAIINSKILFLIRSYRKSFFDKTLGLAFGFARGVLIVCLAFFCMKTVSEMIEFGGVEKGGTKRYGPGFLVDAKTYNVLNYSTEIILATLPDGLQEYMVERVSEVKDRVVKSMADGGTKDAVPRALNKDEMKVMAKIKSAIPEKAYEKIKTKYEAKGDDLSELDKMSIFRDILNTYSESLANGEISEEDAVLAEDFDMLKNIVNGTQIENKELPQEDGTGYKQLNIKQLDRLVDTVNEGE
ncbi:MAG: CvpA family protein [Rickettsiales bacterium]|nr:CvpA family protein [Pseudomonadota bacterium]MDA0965334.1 CvpA family protein [Pseudomonadota bacterium]MDG4544439.1 CvpA family protein [Rickettsiales bacterium]MDG4546569.1 CvpA family protein [Rickettsiales bacterium]MDG4548759.1 CvpA family protein [Rickettsiales bacterium]